MLIHMRELNISMFAIALYLLSTIPTTNALPSSSPILTTHQLPHHHDYYPRLAHRPRAPQIPSIPPTENVDIINYEPILDEDFPDPSIVAGEEDGTFYAFATNNGKVHVQMASSSGSSLDSIWNLELDWDPLPQVGNWVNNAIDQSDIRSHSVWAPDVYRLPNGNYVLYYAARLGEDTRLHCLGAGISTTGVRGPYLVDEDKPFICDRVKGGNIDASAFFDIENDKLYLVYKIDGNAIDYKDPISGNSSTPIMLQELDKNDGITKIGRAIPIFDRCDECDDGALVEAPAITRNMNTGKYYLFYSSGGYADASYTTKYAVSSTSITGPYIRTPGQPLLHTLTEEIPLDLLQVGTQLGDDTSHGEERVPVSLNISLTGPGGADIDSSTGLMLFHHVKSGPPNKLNRPMFAAKIQYNDDDTISMSQWFTPTKETLSTSQSYSQCDGLYCFSRIAFWFLSSMRKR